MAAVQGAHDANPREHHRAIEIGHEHQRLDCGLPFRERGFLFGNPVMLVAASRNVTSTRPSGNVIGSSNSRLQPVRFDISLTPGRVAASGGTGDQASATTRYPMPPTGPLALKFGRTSAPLLPHPLHAKRASRSDSRTSSGAAAIVRAIDQQAAHA
jgi:hypothetical protein